MSLAISIILESLVGIIIFAVISVVMYHVTENVPLPVLLMLFGVIVSMAYSIWHCTNTASGVRHVKDFQSEISNGIERTITVYNLNGEIIKIYTGKFDVDSSQETGRIKFDDEEGKRHIIYNTTGIITIDEN